MGKQVICMCLVSFVTVSVRNIRVSCWLERGVNIWKHLDTVFLFSLIRLSSYKANADGDLICNKTGHFRGDNQKCKFGQLVRTKTECRVAALWLIGLE